MPRKETVISIFVASPSDVVEERSVLNDTVNELNGIWSGTLGLRLELLGWETHTHPAAGADAQQVINKQIGDKYDIFIGILWTKFGTPTAEYKSGTEEEFYRAKKRFDEHKEPKVMFYFKEESPKILSLIDPAELAKINSFREALGKEGVYYWKFHSSTQFGTSLRTHLSKQIQEFQSNEKNKSPVDQGQQETKSGQLMSVEDTDKGLLDLFEESENKATIFSEAGARMTESIMQFGKKLEARTIELNSSIAQDQNEMRRRAMGKRISDMAAGHMRELSQIINQELPILKQTQHDVIDCYGKAIPMMISLTGEKSVGLLKSRESFDALEAVLNQTYGKVDEFKKSILAAPELTGSFIGAKRVLVAVIDELLNIFLEGLDDLSEVKKAVDLLNAGRSD